MHKVYLSLGGNIGNKPKNFKNAYIQIINEIGEIILSSSIYETPPWGFESKDIFWNQALSVHSLLNPAEILEKIKIIEAKSGRDRHKSVYSSRQMDIDILYYDDLYLENDDLIIPHPLLQNRKFVLVPLVEIAPDFVHPLLRQTNFQLLENCRDRSVIKKIYIDF